MLIYIYLPYFILVMDSYIEVHVLVYETDAMNFFEVEHFLRVYYRLIQVFL